MVGGFQNLYLHDTWKKRKCHRMGVIKRVIIKRWKEKGDFTCKEAWVPSFFFPGFNWSLPTPSLYSLCSLLATRSSFSLSFYSIIFGTWKTPARKIFYVPGWTVNRESVEWWLHWWLCFPWKEMEFKKPKLTYTISFDPHGPHLNACERMTIKRMLLDCYVGVEAHRMEMWTDFYKLLNKQV